MVAYAYGYPNPPAREWSGPGGVPIAPSPEPSTPGSTHRAMWFIGGVVAAAVLFAGGATGTAVVNHARETASSGPQTSGLTAFQQWWAGAEKDFTDMWNDVDEAFSRFSPGSLAAACQHVHDRAGVKLQSHLPSPDRKLTAELNAGIEDFRFAADLCGTAVADSSAIYDGEFLTFMAQANKHMMRAAQDVIDKMLINV